MDVGNIMDQLERETVKIQKVTVEGVPFNRHFYCLQCNEIYDNKNWYMEIL